MRFAYIDSNGNEVPIASVDALAIRIELGAITEDTQLYDSAADQWGPAHSHEIFHTLQRSTGEDDGFVAPPPVAPAPVAETESVQDPDPGAEAAPGNVSELTLADASAATESDESGLPDLDLSLAEPEVGTEDLALVGDGGLDLAPVDDSVSEAQDAAPADHVRLDGTDVSPAPERPEGLELADEDALEEGEVSGFDFGAVEGGLELDDSFESEPSMDLFSGDLATGAPDLGADGDVGTVADPTPDFSGGMELETAMEFDSGGFEGEGGELDLEVPMSDFSPEEPPSWMEGEGDEEDEALDFSSVGSTSEEGDPAEDRKRRTPKNRPSPPKHRRQRNLALPILGGVVVLAIGVGGYTAWPMLSERLAARGEPDVPRVVIPELAEELMPQMESAAAAAMEASFSEVVSVWNTSDRPSAPGSDWPGGAYMASASQYEVVEDFWNGMSELVGLARAISLADFDAALGRELSVRGVGAADAAAIHERADSGFVAAAPARQATWDRLAAVVDASLALHRFVLANEAGLEFVPASTATTNPVLEVDAANPEVSSALDDMLGAVVDALADLGYREAVSSQGLRSHVLGELQALGIE